ncbi:hypothetical protein SNEBB_009206 [Seison nebaliae]|nr:hypothetical protein SNEBB_009206 [Seison nebaliae]
MQNDITDTGHNIATLTWRYKKKKLMRFGGESNGRFKLERHIASGTFGDVYLCRDLEPAQDPYEVGKVVERCCAIKVEKESSNYRQLQVERKILSTLKGNLGIPKIFYFGNIEGNDYLTMELLGPSVEDLFNFCFRKFTLKTVLLLFEQMLCRVQLLHDAEYVHRDLKPDNFLMGINSKYCKVYLIDFGLSKKYCDIRLGLAHVPNRSRGVLLGTPRYISLTTHRGTDHARRDDFESLIYVLIYLLKGELPWQGIAANTKNQRYQKIAELKASYPPDVLCKSLPVEFTILSNYVRHLGFMQRPDYNYVRYIFRHLFNINQYSYDGQFDWLILARKLADTRDQSLNAQIGFKMRKLAFTKFYKHIHDKSSTKRSFKNYLKDFKMWLGYLQERYF